MSNIEPNQESNQANRQCLDDPFDFEIDGKNQKER